MVMNLPYSHKNVFTYLIEFLKELLYYSNFNGLEPKVLGKWTCSVKIFNIGKDDQFSVEWRSKLHCFYLIFIVKSAQFPVGHGAYCWSSQQPRYGCYYCIV